MSKIITKDLNIRHEVVRVYWRRRNKARIIQYGVVSKGLSEEFSLIRALSEGKMKKRYCWRYFWLDARTLEKS